MYTDTAANFYWSRSGPSIINSNVHFAVVSPAAPAKKMIKTNRHIMCRCVPIAPAITIASACEYLVLVDWLVRGRRRGWAGRERCRSMARGSSAPLAPASVRGRRAKTPKIDIDGHGDTYDSYSTPVQLIADTPCVSN